MGVGTGKARKGDAVLIERTQTTYTNTGPATKRTDYTFMVVASATRDGQVKTVADVMGERGHDIPTYWNAKRWVVEASRVDVPGLLAAFEARQWPNREARSYDHGRYPFATFDEAREFAAPFLLHPERRVAS